jgi:hypothetical protein
MEDVTHDGPIQTLDGTSKIAYRYGSAPPSFFTRSANYHIYD